MKLVNQTDIGDVTIKSFEGKRRPRGGGKWTPVRSTVATHSKLEDTVEFELINDYDEYVLSLHFADGWDEVQIVNGGMVTSMSKLDECIIEVEVALKQHYGVK